MSKYEEAKAEYKLWLGKGNLIRALGALAEMVETAREATPAGTCICQTVAEDTAAPVTDYITNATISASTIDDIAWFHGKLERAKASANPDPAQIAKLEKQIALLEDATVIHRLIRTPDRKVFHIDVGDLPPEEARAKLEEIKANIEAKKAETAEEQVKPKRAPRKAK